MEATGREIARHALELVSGGDGDIDDQDPDIERLAQFSPFVLNMLNAEAATAVGGTSRSTVTLPAGRDSFTWGPGGDVDAAVPSDVSAWSVVNTAGYPEPRGRMLTTREWADLQYWTDFDCDDSPLKIHWPRTLDGDGRFTFYIWPKLTRETVLHLWASVPKLDRISLGTTYRLDPARGMYLVLKLARHAAAVWGWRVTPEMLALELQTADAIDAQSEQRHLLKASPRWVIGEHTHNISVDVD